VDQNPCWFFPGDCEQKETAFLFLQGFVDIHKGDDGFIRKNFLLQIVPSRHYSEFLEETHSLLVLLPIQKGNKILHI